MLKMSEMLHVLLVSPVLERLSVSWECIACVGFVISHLTFGRIHCSVIAP